MKLNEPPAMVKIGGTEVPLLLAALMCQEADRQGVPVDQVGLLSVPSTAPMRVEVAGFLLTLDAAAQVAAMADRRGVAPRKVVEFIVEAALVPGRPPMRARKRGVLRMLAGVMVSRA
jgi:hypothetical protein